MTMQKPEAAPQHSEEDFNWESRLEKLRQNRQLNTPNVRAPLVRESEAGRRFAAAPKPAAARKPDDKIRDKILREYLLKWQEEHNAAVAESGEAVETDAMVLLQENWLSAQNALQTQVSDKHIESSRNVWYNPKKQSVEFPAAEPEDETPSEAQPQPDLLAEIAAAEAAEAADRVPVTINILNPQAVKRQGVFCLSEQELTERLIKRMRPHLTDAVNGMIRTTLQKQMALLAYQVQQTLSEQAPDLVEDVLTHNLQRVLADIKNEMKYKQK
ncbi:hypothetical protein [Bergeriella denitrificans]|uniref:Uncharacterized protein n=1 Tax=Bergeriella denitrificans TaxID=494 RepID=A0A378UFH3_BERDE|nr:hypothetical protein [Bergeriella denitrificans]STZ75493.1 Uncharacterised protein [Bergeriella denitrificans]